MMYRHGFHGQSDDWLVMAVLCVMVGVALGVLLIWALGASASARQDKGRVQRLPVDVLAHRFARGEIDAEEYAAALRVLEQHER